MIALLLAVTAPGVALAHSDLEASTPFDGEVLSAAPTEVTLTFNEDLLPDFVNVVAQDAGGAVTELALVSVDGPTAVVAWPADLPGGQWRVDYRVVSQDGHPVEGAISFSYPAASPSPSSASPTPTPTPTSESPTPVPTTATPTPIPTSASASPTDSPAPDDSPTNTGWIIAGIVVLVLVVVTVIGVAVRRRDP